MASIELDIPSPAVASALTAEQERVLKLATDSFPGFVSYVDPNLRYVFNNAAYRHIGVDPASLKGRPVREVLGEKAFRQIVPYMRQALAGEKVSYRGTLVLADGRSRLVDLNYVPDVVDGQVRGFVALIHWTGQEELELQQRLLANVMENVPAVVWETRGAPGKEHRLSFLNHYVETLLGFPVAHWLKRPEQVLEVVHPDDRDRVRDEARRLLAAGKGGRLEFRCAAKDNRLLWMEAQFRPVVDREGRLVGTRGMAVDITVRKQAEETLIRHDQAQREFVANVSHDFRTPIAAIKGYAETLVRGALADRRNRARFTRTILKNAERLACLVEDVLLVSTIESGRIAGSPEAIPLLEFVDSYLEDIAALVRKSRQSVQVEIPAKLEVWADRVQLGKILQNLVGNALRYNKPGQWVRVSAQTRNDKAVVSVKDCGIGIAREHLPRIFERFYRVEKKRSVEGGETGLGLHIVKQLVEVSGNKVWVNSAVGKGSTFYFTADLPKAR